MEVRQGNTLSRLLEAEILLFLAAGTLAAQDVRYDHMPGLSRRTDCRVALFLRQRDQAAIEFRQ